jgi:hypothetical protein
VSVDLDAGTSITTSSWSRVDLEEAVVELHGVIELDGALVLEAADAAEVCRRRCGAPIRGGVRWFPSESGVVAWEKAVEHALGLGERARLGEAEFDDKAILEGAKEPLDAALGLRGTGADPTDAEFLESSADLGGRRPALELLSEGKRGTGIAVEDPVAVGVGHSWEAVAADDLAEEEEVAVSVFLQAEDAAEDSPGGVIDRSVEDEPRPTVFEPGVMAAVHLDEETGLGHAFAAAAMAWGTALTGAADPGGAEESLHGAARDAQALALDEHLGKVVVIHVGIAGAGQGEDAGPEGFREAAGRGASAVAMGEGSEALLPQEGKEAAEVPQ